jgi:hypothetical protein
MPTQVRVYRIAPGELSQFVREWREQIAPLRERHGFVVEHAWASEEEDTFVWILRYDGDDWAAADRAYYDSDERRAMDPDPARLIESPDAFFVSPVAWP